MNFDKEVLRQNWKETISKIKFPPNHQWEDDYGEELLDYIQNPKQKIHVYYDGEEDAESDPRGIFFETYEDVEPYIQYFNPIIKKFFIFSLFRRYGLRSFLSEISFQWHIHTSQYTYYESYKKGYVSKQFKDFIESADIDINDKSVWNSIEKFRKAQKKGP